MQGPDARDETGSRLLAEACGGNEKAFRKLVERYHPMVYAVVRGVLGDRWDVEDVIQEVFVKVFRGLSGFRGDAKPSTWVYTIAKNEALNAARRKVPVSESIEDVTVETHAGSRPDEQYRRKVLREHLDRCLSELEENYRVALELRYSGDMSYEEISEAMGVPVGTVKTFIHRGKIELRRIIARKELVEAHGRRQGS